MIDLESFVGSHVWELHTINDKVFCVPDLNWCAKVLFLLIISYFMVRSIINICNLFR